MAESKEDLELDAVWMAITRIMARLSLLEGRFEELSDKVDKGGSI